MQLCPGLVNKQDQIAFGSPTLLYSVLYFEFVVYANLDLVVQYCAENKERLAAARLPSP